MSFSAHVLTLFPAMFPGPLGQSLAGKALADKVWSLDVRDIRDHGLGKHRTVDDTPAGGGPGMVMRVDVACAAIDAARDIAPSGVPVLVTSPRGRRFDQGMARELAAGPGAIFFCGRFEGVDERLFQLRQVTEVSLGDFVLSGGEPAALAMLDAIVRLLPGVMGAAESGTEESFESGLLEYPHYTRPQVFDGLTIPEVLSSGNHAAIRAFRQAQARSITKARRPDLISGASKDPKKTET